MNNRVTIHAIITTSGGRTQTLLARALKSVYLQRFSAGVCVVIVDDNEDSGEFERIKSGVAQLRKSLKIGQKFPTQIIKNTRTKGHSSTGASNTSALFCADFRAPLESQFFAFLDDDDSWQADYLAECHAQISRHKNAALVACGIKFIKQTATKTSAKNLYPSAKTLTPQNIFVKNPHIQGSNLFISAAAFFGAGGFDESLKSTTDRDLMMRYVEFIKVNPHLKSIFVKKALVNYFCDTNLKRISNDIFIKKQGLDLFYRKYSHRFKAPLQRASLTRAKELFDYKLSPQILPIFKENKNIITTKKSLVSPINLALGVISYETLNLKNFIQSFFALKPSISPFIKEFQIFIISTKSLANEIQTLIIPYKNIKIKYTHKRHAIAKSRTLLQKWIYKEIKNTNFVAWIVDDDVRFWAFSENKRYEIDYFYHISRLKNEKVDALLCKNCDQPPLPFFSLLRTQLLDLYFLLTNPRKVHKYNDFSEDFYYDLSKANFCHLEYPFFCQKSVKEFINSLCVGQTASRTLEFNPSKIAKIDKNSIARGGNTLVFNLRLLKTKNFTPKNTKYNRRSDFNWAIINADLLGFDIKECNLPLTHSRGHLPLCYEKEWEKFKSDLLGQCFYRLLQSICQNISCDKMLSYSQCKALFYARLSELKQRLIANTLRIKTLNAQIKILIQKDLQYEQLDLLILKFMQDTKKFVSKKQKFINKKTFKKITKWLLKIKNL